MYFECGNLKEKIRLQKKSLFLIRELPESNNNFREVGIIYSTRSDLPGFANATLYV
jgi:hypothetical protein